VPVRTGKPGRQHHQGGVSQIGSAIGNHATNRSNTGYKGDPVRGAFRPPGTPGSVPLGNKLATNVGAGGPGKGRDVMASGSQSTYGQPAPGNPPPAGELFPGWGTKR
jgi:hypothetical protein